MAEGRGSILMGFLHLAAGRRDRVDAMLEPSR